MYSTTLERSYRGDDGKWASTKSFDLNSLLLVGKVANEADSWIRAELASTRRENG